MKITVFILSVLMSLCFMLTGCGGGSQAVNAPDENAFANIVDDEGNTVVLREKPQRIVVLSASFLEPLHEVGGDVVGRPDSKTKMPDYAKNAESIGQVYQIDAEKVVSLKPDLVIANKGMNEKVAKLLNDNSIPTIVMDMKNYDSIKNELRVFAQVTGEKEKAEAIIADMDNRINVTLSKLPKDNSRQKKVAIIHSTAQGLSLQLDGSIAGSISKLIGWENIAGGMTPLDKNPDAAPYSLETLVQQNPDIVFITSMGSIESIKKNMDKEMDANPAWRSVAAVENNLVYYLPQDLFLLSPGIHYPEAVEYMAKLIYPRSFY